MPVINGTLHSFRRSSSAKYKAKNLFKKSADIRYNKTKCIGMWLGCNKGIFPNPCALNEHPKDKTLRQPFFQALLQPVIGSKNSILNWVMKLSLYMPIFFLFIFENPFKDFPFYSPIFLTFWFRYLKKRIKEIRCQALSHWTKQTVKKLNLCGKTAVDKIA